MAKTIPQLTDATTVNAADELIIQQGGITKRATKNELMTFAATGAPSARLINDRFADIVNVKDFGAVGDGVTDDTAALQQAISAGLDIQFPEGTYKIDANITVAANKTLRFMSGASITASSSYTITLNNNAFIEAPRTQIFSGSATAANVKTAFPEWWGATHSTTIAQNGAFQSALNALKEQGQLLLNNGFYALDGTTALTVNKGQAIIGAGSQKTTFRITTAATNAFLVTTTLGAALRGFKVANTVAATSGTAIKVEQTSPNTVGRFTIEDIWLESVYNGINLLGNSVQTLNTARVSNVYMRGVYNYGARYEWCENILSLNIHINADTGSGSGAPNSGFVLFNKCQSVDFTNCSVNNCSGAGLFVSNSSATISRGSDVRWCQFIGCLFDDCENGVLLDGCSDLRFVNCWASSNGRTVRGYSGNGVWLKQNTEAVLWIGGVASNNGQRGFRIESAGEGACIKDVQIVGNSVNDTTTNPFYGVDVFGGVSGFSITGCMIDGTDYGWSDGDSRGIQVRSGASDNYLIAHNLISNTYNNNALVDSGSGINKVVQDNVIW
jgi:hypothetical protein